ncbi:hypothetical protein KC19_4G009200 [Ceratodon purpureus]|uniref:Alliinase C-terminal domain-containing protein n=1 Tax=Ceratodon purpureus TaxID=3225 RepID=A0A8T0I6C9_CERPU|nr:hypothetical protein KC19_4G009200 [Ceratodon purpureus]
MAASGNNDAWQLVRARATEKKYGDQVTPDASSPLSKGRVILNCEHGDPTMFEEYWDVHQDDNVMVTRANEGISYFVKSKMHQRGPWFVSVELDDAVRELHALVGNAVTRDKFIVVGTGSTQIFQAALYALASRNGTSTPVVSEFPCYTGYPQTIKYLQSKLFHWAGDSKTYQPKGDEVFIEVVCSPNNPCGEIREGLLAGRNNNGVLVHDLAYYWPTYTPITMALNNDVMMFTLSKCTGHAGLRIGWAIVKDPQVAKKMVDFIGMNTIGVSRDAQLRAASIIRTVVKGYQSGPLADSIADGMHTFLSQRWPFIRGDVLINAILSRGKLFHWSKAVMENRWGKVRSAVAANRSFSIREPPLPAICTFLGTASSPSSAFIWLKYEEEADCQKILQRNGILARGGPAFGVSAQYARLSLLGREQDVDLLVKRLATLK